jgi:hypothetical protein
MGKWRYRYKERRKRNGTKYASTYTFAGKLRFVK